MRGGDGGQLGSVRSPAPRGAHERQLAAARRRELRRRRRVGLATGAAIGAAAFAAPAAHATDYVVKNTDDSGADSLRAAITAANGSDPAADTITFDPAVTGTIRLTTGQLLVNDPGLTIDGP